MMKLLIVGPRWVGGWTEGVGRAALALGHAVSLFYYRSDAFAGVQSRAEVFLPRRLQKGIGTMAKGVKWARDFAMNRRLLDTARTFRPDLILILKGETISRESLQALRAHKIRVVSWWVDDPFHFPEFVRIFGLLDRLYMFDKDCIVNLEAQGIKHIEYLPCAYDQSIFYPQRLNPDGFPLFKCTVGFVATYHPVRAALLSKLRGIDVGIWGGGWEAAEGLNGFPIESWRADNITPTDAAKVYNLAKICPNVHHPQTKRGGMNTRTYEIIAAGGFELTDNVRGLEEHFEIGREILVYDSPEHFRELVDYYLSNPVERTDVIQRGRARVMRDHTYERRLQFILETIER